MNLYKIIMGVIVVALFGVSIFLSEMHANSIEKELENSKARILTMSEEHERSMKAAEKAMREREAIFEREKEKFCKAQEAIGANPDFCRAPIPDDFRLLWKDDATAGSAVPATGEFAGSR